MASGATSRPPPPRADPTWPPAADLLGGSLEASARLCLLEALSDAAAEITTKLDARQRRGASARSRGPVRRHRIPTRAGGGAGNRATDQPSTAGPATQATSARITLRLPEGLKEAVERAAAAEGISVNAWLVRAIAHVVAGPPPGPGFPPPGFHAGFHRFPPGPPGAAGSAGA